jgi:alpha-mannosidase
MAHDGRWWSETVQAEADLIADPLRFVPASADGAYEIRPVAYAGQQARFHALKPADEGHGYILRLSEAAGRRGVLRLTVPGVALPVDAMEEPLEGAVTAIERPFGLSSFRFG